MKRHHLNGENEKIDVQFHHGDRLFDVHHPDGCFHDDSPSCDVLLIPQYCCDDDVEQCYEQAKLHRQ